MRYTGFNTSTFAARSQVQLPGQKIYSSKPPVCYTPQHMFIGATLFINGFKFVLTDADEYALRYMEVNCGLVRHMTYQYDQILQLKVLLILQFPKANLKRIMEKVREKLRPIYKDFVAENIPKESAVISYSHLRYKLSPMCV